MIRIRVLFAASLLVGVALAACSANDRKENPVAETKERAKTPTPDVRLPPGAFGHKAKAIEPKDVRWETYRSEALKIGFNAFAAVPVQEGQMGEAKFAKQRVGPITTAVWKGPSRTIESWREGVVSVKDHTLSPTQEMKICGVDAQGQEARVKRGSDRTIRIVAFRHQESGVIASWGIDTAAREAYREIENQFLSSLVCD